MSPLAPKPCHILYLIDELKVKGGSEKHLFELATGMAAAGFRITVFALAEGVYAQEFQADSRIRYVCFNSPRIYDVKGLATLFKIATYIRNEQVSILQSFHAASDLIGPLAARLSLRHPKVLSSRRDLGYTKSKRHRKIQRYVNYLVDGILANSQAVKQSVCAQEGFPAERISVIYNGINIEPFVPNQQRRTYQRETFGVACDTVVIGSVGNIRPVKGYDLLVEAAGVVCRQLPNVHFFHAGEGKLLKELRWRCCQLGIEDRFTFLGSVKDVPSFLNSLDIYVQPSRSEGFSNAILEAMASRLPVVASRAGGNIEIVDDGVNGVLFESCSIQNLATELVRLLSDSALRVAMGEAATGKVKRDYTYSIMSNKYQCFYENVTRR